MKKLFVVSDLHGFFSLFKEALEQVGFDPNNESHMLIVIGDCFDRGTENLKMLQYLELITNKVLVRGNHEDHLLDIINRGYLKDYDYANGTDRTVTELFGKYALLDGTGKIDFSGKTRMVDRVVDFISDMKDYYETSSYVFVHGWVPIQFHGKEPYIDRNWRMTSSSDEWKNARYLEWQQTYDKGLLLEDKTIICGHRPASLGHLFDITRYPDDNSIFYGNKVIAIDANTYRSQKINLLVLEDELV